MSSVELHEADLPKLVSTLESGTETEITILRDGKAIVRLVAVPPRKPVRLGLGQGMYKLDIEVFNGMDAEIERLFEESADPFGEKLSR